MTGPAVSHAAHRFALLLVLALAGAHPARAQDVGLPLGTIPKAVVLEDLDGKPVNLADYIGRKPVLIEFWATWCPLCEELEPSLTAARKAHGSKAEFLIIAVGVGQTPRTIKRHLARHAPPGKVLFDAKGAAVRAFEAPTTSYIVVLDRSGRVSYTGTGGKQDLVREVRKVAGPGS